MKNKLIGKWCKIKDFVLIKSDFPPKDEFIFLLFVVKTYKKKKYGIVKCCFEQTTWKIPLNKLIFQK